MAIVHVQKGDFDKILKTAETLVDEVECALSQDEIVRTRIEDIKLKRVIGKSEKELDDYLKKRGVKID